MQTGQANTLRPAVLEPLEAEQHTTRTARAAKAPAKASATKVDFFTMVRGED